MIKFYFVILIPVLIFTDLSKVAYAQFEDIKFIYGDYTFITKYDTAMFTTRLRIKKEDKSIFSKIFYERIGSIKDYDLDNDGKKEGIFSDIHTSILVMSDRMFFNAISDVEFMKKNNITLRTAFDEYFRMKCFGFIKQ